MNHFRSWSRRAWVLHGYLIATLALVPLQPVNSTWTDGDADGSNETWTTSEGVSYSLSQLDAIDIDVDHDGAYNEEELAAGSDPFLYDTDDDGLNDGDEIHLANQQNGHGYSLTNWDSNGDGVSDHDDFYGCFSVTYPNGELPGFSGAKYFDYDGDGIKNPLDLYPADPLNNDADGDGIDDSTDPAPGDPYNTSSANGQQWGSGAMGDDDSDSILNFYDAWPSDSANGNNDSDSDGYDNGSDPFPSDYSNFSSANSIYWYGDLFGDSDSDGVPNYNDSWPYDSSNGASNTSNDDDGDGITNDLDPAPSDYNNNSPHNNTAWSWYPLEDADNDGQSNFFDPFPYDQYDNQPDFDGDGWPNESDPFPRDNSNYSEVNSTAWQTALFEDPDGDGVPNWQDPYPSDFYNGDTDYDDDGIVNESDPFPTDGANYSEFNQTSWGGSALGDDDSDGVLNWQDPTPSGDGPSTSDSDGDMIDDSIDPAPSDNTNYSSINGQSWYGEVFSDEDGDGTLNFWDQWIGDPHNGYPPTYDTDGDGYSDDVDPASGDFSNYSSYNNTCWYSDALNDADNDGTSNFYDYQPNGDSNVDSDGDGLYDSNDPAPGDYANYSYINNTWWYSNALGDDDSDTIINFDDPYPSGPPPPPDSDGDGLDVNAEQYWGTSDNAVDTDGDGLNDDEEVNCFGTHPANAYSRSQYLGWGDRYTDWELVDLTDSDGDGIPSRIEQHYGLNPNWAGDALLDRDNDGTNNISQYQAGMALDLHLDAYDADEDGMTDVFEDAYSQVLSRNDPGDAVLDADGDGVLNYEEHALLISPMNMDTIQLGGLKDLQWLMLSVRYAIGTSPPETDADDNGIPDWADTVHTTPTAPDYYHFTRALAEDLDGDGMPDAWEHQYGRWKHPAGGLDPRLALDAGRDPDGDGLSNLTEYRFGTNPLAPETQQGLNDRSKFYRKGSPTVTTGSALLSRYKAQVAADLAGTNTLRGFGFRDTPDPVPDDNGGDGNGDSPSFEMVNVVKTHKPQGGGVPWTEPLANRQVPGDLESGTNPGGNDHPCSAVDCGTCENGWVTTNCPDCSGNSGKSCGMPHSVECPPQTQYCPGHTVRTQVCYDPLCPHDQSSCFEDTCSTCPDSEPCTTVTCTACGGTGMRSTPCDGTCIFTCSRNGCNDGQIQVACTNPDCDQGYLTNACGCPNPGCQCGGSDLNCVYNSTDPEEDWEESATVTITYPDEKSKAAYYVLAGGSVAGTLSRESPSVAVGPATGGETLHIDYRPVEGSDDDSQSLMAVNVSLADGAGSRYRKIGLNGLPLSDSKPQDQDESGELPEETYIDAYTRQLRHSVTDFYEKADGTELPLMVRRDVSTEITSLQSGIRTSEKPHLPFGPAWSSNVCAYIKYEHTDSNEPEPRNKVNRNDRATVFDEQGGSQSFVRGGGQLSTFTQYTGLPGATGPWVHTGEEQLDAKTKQNTLFGTPYSMVLTKKFGSTCFYEGTTIEQKMSADRKYGSHEKITVNYLRLIEVRDRLGNRLLYEYPGTGTLIPSKIYDPDRPGRCIQILQQGGQVAAIKGPGGQEVAYSYTGACLREVSRGGTSVKYAYESVEEDVIEPEINPPPEEPDQKPALPHTHTNLLSIEDELGRAYVFGRTFDHGTTHVTMTDSTIVERVQQGLPRLVTGIMTPRGPVGISGYRSLTTESRPLDLGAEADAFVSTSVSALDGSVVSYGFGAPDMRWHSPEYNWLGEKVGISLLCTFTHMTISRGADGVALGSESFSFSPSASMALAGATDRSGNLTTFTYDGDFDDPASETVYLQNADGTATPVTKHFTYDPATRIMTSMTDAMGVRTEYEIDNSRTITRDGMTIEVRGLKTDERVFNASGQLLRQTRYSYDHPTFSGLVTKQWTISSSEEVMPSSVTLTTLGQPQDGQGANPGWWREVTQTSGTATGQGGLAEAISSTTTIHDFNGAKRSVIDGRGFITNFDYDEAGRLVSVNHPDGSSRSLDYDAHGNLIHETNENGVSTFHEYDSLNRRIQTTLDLNGNGSPDPSYNPASSGPTGTTISYDGDIVTTTTYNQRSQVTSQTDPRGLITVNDYDAAGRLISVNRGGLLTEFFYDGVNNGGSVFDTSAIKPNRTIDPRGVQTSVVYDSLYRPVSSTVMAPGITAVTLTTYDAAGRPLTVTDPLGRVTTNVYDGLGQLVEVIEPDTTVDTTDNPSVRTFYTHHGKPWKVIDQMGHETRTLYDALGRPVQVVSPAVDGVSALTTTEYDAAGNVIKVTDPLGRETETVYDERNRPVVVYAPTVWDANAAEFVRPVTQTAYDALGQVTHVTDPMGAITTKHYDRAGRNWKVEAPAIAGAGGASSRPTTITTFDPGGLALTVTNPLSQTVTNTYDAHGRLITTLDAEGITNSFAYDAAGNRTSVKDGLNQETTFAYDGLNRLVRQTFANEDEWTYEYNAVQKLSQTSPRGIVTSYSYDARDRLLTVDSPTPGGSGELHRRYTYDNAGRLLTVSESPSLPFSPSPSFGVSYTYDAMGRVTAESSHGQSHFYQYDLAGNRTQATYSTGRVVETTYDGLNRPHLIAEGGRLTRYGYDLAGRAVVLVAGNGQTSQNTYDALGRLTDRTLFRTQAMTDSDVLAEFAWHHDLLGNVTMQEEIWPGESGRAAGVRSTTMGYDDNNRLTSETISHPTEGTQSTTYTYDDANNRRSKTVNGGAEPGHWDYDYNVANQLTAWEHLDYPGGSVLRSASLTYDEAGNRTSQAVTQVSGSYNPTYNPQPSASGLTTYTWDAQDRLASVTMPDGTVHEYEYDYRTRRTGVRTLLSAVQQTMTAIVFAGGLSLAEYDVSASPSSSIENPASSIVQYVRGPDMGGGVGGMLYSLRGGITKYSLSNGRGDIVAQADQGANLTWTASYEAYGKRTKETGTNLDKQRANSKDEDPTGLLNEGFRYRDIETGVWLSRDPAGFVDGPNLYAYVKENPWSAFDPKGLNKVAVCGGPNKKENDPLKFVRAAARNLDRARVHRHEEGEKYEMIIHKSSLERRAKDDGRKADYYINEIESMAKNKGFVVRYFEDASQLANALNTTVVGGKRNGSSLISEFTYFGHSAPGKLWLNPGREYGDDAVRFKRDHLNLIQKDSFRPNAVCTSWGCNSGSRSMPGDEVPYDFSNNGEIQSFADEWESKIGLPMHGLVGRSDYAPVTPRWYDQGFYKDGPAPGTKGANTPGITSETDSKLPSEWDKKYGPPPF